MLNKYEQKELILIRVILEKGKLKDGKEAIGRWIAKAGENKEARQRRAEAANRLLNAFYPEGWGEGKGLPKNGSYD